MWLPIDAEFLSCSGTGSIHAARTSDVLVDRVLSKVETWSTVCGANPTSLVLVRVENSEPFVAPFPPPRSTHATYGVSCVECMIATGLREFGEGSALDVDEADS